MRLRAIRNRLKRTIFVSGGIELLQMVLESDAGGENVRPPKRWIMRSHLGLERGMKHFL